MPLEMGQIGPRELNKQLTPALVNEAYSEGMNFSRWLEERDPSNQYASDTAFRGTTALERQLYFSDIRTTADPSLGLVSDQFGKFGKTEAGKALMGEWMAHHWRKVSHQSEQQRKAMNHSVLTSDLTGVGTAFRPYFDAAQLREATMQPAIPVSELVALTTGIDQPSYRAMYLQDTPPDQVRMVRVGETADLPKASITLGQTEIDLYRYGRMLEFSYDLARRAPIPLVAHWIARLAVQSEVDKVSTIYGVLVNGDGNPNTAARVIPLHEVASGTLTANEITKESWIGFKLKWRNPNRFTTELAPEAVIKQQILLELNDESAGNGTGAGSFLPIGDSYDYSVRWGILDDVAANTLVGFDRNVTIERVWEIGANISETGKWIEKQTNGITFTEIEGYSKIEPKGALVLDLADVTP